MSFLVLKKPGLPDMDRAPLPTKLELSPNGTRAPRVVQPLARARISLQSQQSVHRYAFYAPGDERSYASLERNGTLLDGLFVDWMAVGSNGSIRKQDVEAQGRAMRWIAHEAPNLRKFAVLTSDQSSTSFAAQVSSLDRARTYASGIVKDIRMLGYDGLLLDFRSFETVRSAAFEVFVSNLKSALAPCACKLAMTAPPSADLRYLAVVANKADLFLLSTQLPAGGSFVPSQSEFEERVRTASRLIPPSKLVIGIGSYASMTSGEGLNSIESVYQAWSLSEAAKAPLILDADLVGRFHFVRKESSQFDVKLLDATTVFNHSRVALSQRPAGIALWRLGLEDPSVWEVFGRGKIPEAAQLAKLEILKPTADLSGQIDGQIFSVEAVHTTGKRRLDFDKSRGLIVGQRLIKAPVSYAATNWGKASETRIALSFDDGPDERFTPQVLDILKEKSAKATFFVTGKNALAHPDLLRRIYNEGHDIGNHTYSHPDLAKRSGFEIDVELNATQRILEKVLGIHTKLFRAPFSSVSFEISPDGLRVLERASRLGYVSLRVTVDPYDWAGPSSEIIANRTLSKIAAMDQTDKNIVILLHDSGGNRKPTLEALPIVIDRLRESGHTFVAAHELMDADHEIFMTRVSENDEVKSIAMLSGMGVDIFAGMIVALPTLTLIAIALGLSRSAFVGFFAARQRAVQRRRSFAAALPKVCVVIPAFNEDKVILKTIESVRASRYPGLEVVVVDDGSTDNTFSVVTDAYVNGEVTLIRVPNAGKASALNSGLSATEAEVVIAIDADTVLDARAIELLARHFNDPSVGAVAGKAVVGNENSIMAKFQSLEYLTSQNLDRRAFEMFNAISVVPGALGAWRRSVLVAIGGFRSDTLAEDADATISMARTGHRILYEPEAVAYTEAPETVRAFLKQRFRWTFGTLQTAFKHRAALFSTAASGVGFIALPNILIFQIGFTLLAPLFDLVFFGNLISVARGAWLGDEISDTVSMLAVYWLGFQCVDAVLLALAARFDGGGAFWRLVPLLVVQRYFYRQLLYIVAFKTLFAALAGTFVGWGKLVRTGNVAANPA